MNFLKKPSNSQLPHAPNANEIHDETPREHLFRVHPYLKKVIGWAIFVTVIVVGTIFINTFLFQSFRVEGSSMESTLDTGDMLMINRGAVTWANIQGKDWTPERGQIIVFKNPKHDPSNPEDPLYIVKRVIAFGGEKVVVADGKITVFNEKNTEGFDPTAGIKLGEKSTPASGSITTEVPEGSLYVVGDHRQSNYSVDSRSGLGTIPLFDVVGPVSFRYFPIQKISGLAQ